MTMRLNGPRVVTALLILSGAKATRDLWWRTIILKLLGR
jgi:hypothetical protein